MADEPVKVKATRADGLASRYVLRVEGHEGAWFVKLWGFRREDFAPYWFKEGKFWHIWAGASQGEGPPLVSVASLAAAKAYVAGLVTGAPPAG